MLAPPEPWTDLRWPEQLRQQANNVTQLARLPTILAVLELLLRAPVYMSTQKRMFPYLNTFCHR